MHLFLRIRMEREKNHEAGVGPLHGRRDAFRNPGYMWRSADRLVPEAALKEEESYTGGVLACARWGVSRQHPASNRMRK